MPDLEAALAQIPAHDREDFLAKLTQEEIDTLRQAVEPLIEFIPRVSPDLAHPYHLAPIVEVFESVLKQSRKVVISTPPQHGKTQTCLHAIAWLMQRNPDSRNAYVTYEAARAQKLSEETQGIAGRAGLQWRGNRKSWKTTDGASLFATGIDSGFTGESVAARSVLIVDDPVKDVVEANSATYRERADEWMQGVALTRMHPGASAVVISTRWHPDDLAGRLIARGWEHIELPAISHEGKALWPEARPLRWLQEQRQRVGEYVWASLYQCTPRARGANVFGDWKPYDPKTTILTGRTVALGVDAAYSEKTYADYSVGVVMARLGDTYYLVEVDRAQLKAPAFKNRLDGLKERHSITRSRWYTSTTEVGLAQMLGITPVIARTDKYVRAQKFAAAWNAGKVLCPQGAMWLPDFIAEMVAFTGIDDLHDDQVDAAAAAFDELEQPVIGFTRTPGVHAPRRF